MNIDEILKMREEIDNIQQDIYSITDSLYDKLEELREVSLKIEEERHNLSRKEFDQWMQHGITLGAKFEIEGIKVPQPLTVVGIACDGFVIQDSERKEYTLYAKNMKMIDRFKVIVDDIHTLSDPSDRSDKSDKTPNDPCPACHGTGYLKSHSDAPDRPCPYCRGGEA